MNYEFKNRIAIVTGGAAGIGRNIANRIARGGGRVMILDADEDAAAQAADEIGGSAIGQVADVSDEAAVQRAVARTEEHFGGLDVVVNSAGITGPNTTVDSYDAAAWRKVMEVNLTGTFLVCKSAIPALRRRGYGRIVNIASVAGKEGNPNASAYSASKAGVIALTKSLGKELANTEIRVNAVTPAAVRTAIFDQMTQEHIDFMLSKIPLGRFGQIDEVASLCCWLASEECSFSTGAVFDISGGRSTY